MFCAGVTAPPSCVRPPVNGNLWLQTRIVWLTFVASHVQDGCPDASLTALFTFVARDPITRKSMPVNPLRPQTEVLLPFITRT